MPATVRHPPPVMPAHARHPHIVMPGHARTCSGYPGIHVAVRPPTGVTKSNARNSPPLPTRHDRPCPPPPTSHARPCPDLFRVSGHPCGRLASDRRDGERCLQQSAAPTSSWPGMTTKRRGDCTRESAHASTSTRTARLGQRPSILTLRRTAGAADVTMPIRSHRDCYSGVTGVETRSGLPGRVPDPRRPAPWQSRSPGTSLAAKKSARSVAGPGAKSL